MVDVSVEFRCFVPSVSDDVLFSYREQNGIGEIQSYASPEVCANLLIWILMIYDAADVTYSLILNFTSSFSGTSIFFLSNLKSFFYIFIFEEKLNFPTKFTIFEIEEFRHAWMSRNRQHMFH